MKNLPTILLSFLLFLLYSTAYGQSKLNIYGKGESLLKKEEYQKVIDYINSLDSNTIQNEPLADYYLGVAYYYSSDGQEKGIPHLEKYIAEADTVQLEHYGHHHVYYLLGKLYHLTYQFDKAQTLYQQFIDMIPAAKAVPEKDKLIMIENAKRQIAHCSYASIAVKNPRNVVIESLGDSINTKFSEYAAVVSQDEKKLLFTSRRPGTTGGKKSSFDNQYYEDIYAADLVKGSLFETKRTSNDSVRGEYFNLATDFEYQNFRNLGERVNSNDHDGSIQLSHDDRFLYYYHNSDVWQVDIAEDTLAEPEKLGVHVNSDEHEPSIFFSYDGAKLFIVSDRAGGYGGLDIYLSEKDDDGNWSNPKNLGPQINTDEDEDAPYFDPDGKTLYFSSKGHSSIGEYDIFRSRLEDTLWSDPVNLGFPVNTAADDIYFTMTKRYNRGYYATSDLAGVGGMDIYRITFADERDPVAELMGLVKKGDTFVPAQSKITMTAIGGDESITKETDTIEGDYFLLLGHGKTYDMKVETDGFAPYHKTFVIPEQKAYFQLYQEVHHVHLYDKDGNIIGQQITVYNATGEADTSTILYAENILATIQKIRDENDIHGYIDASSEIRFYMTEDSLRSLMLDDPSIDFNFGPNVSILFLNDANADPTSEFSYRLFEGVLSRAEFLKEGDDMLMLTLDNSDSPTEVASVDVKNITGLFFTVQIGVYSRDVEHSVLYNLEPLVTEKTKNKKYRYSTGTYSSEESAAIRKNEIVKIGIQDAFVTAYYKGDRISLEQARQLIQEHGTGIIFGKN